MPGADMPSSTERARALEEIVALARQHGLSAAEIAAAIGEPSVGTPSLPESQPARDVLVHVLGFLGGIFVFAGIGVFIAFQWSDMNSAARVVATLGSGLAALAFALLFGRDARFEKAATAMFLIAALLEPTGMLVAFDEFGSGGDWRLASLITVATMALQFGAIYRSIRRSTPLFMIILFCLLFWWTALDLLEVDNTLVALVLGTSVLLAAVGVDRMGHRGITPVWYLFGTALFLYGLFDAVKRTPFEVLFVAAAAGFVYLSVALKTRMLLFAATMAILAYTGWFTGEHFADSIGWPIALMLFGVLMIGMSALAFKIDRHYLRHSHALRG
jgi:hypothetical protein